MRLLLQDSVTAITFVALGTSLPDLFASKQAATMDDTADNSIGNVTGSNSVNVFLGLGLPWLIAAIFWKVKVDAGTWVRYLDCFTCGQFSCRCLSAGWRWWLSG